MRLRTLAAVGIGYVLGTRAGGKRYEDMQRLYHDVVESDTFAQVVQRGKETLGEGVRMVTGTMPSWAEQDGEAESEGGDEQESTGESAEAEESEESEEEPTDEETQGSEQTT